MKYPKHIYDKQRIEIATQFMQKRLLKMFPSLNEAKFELIKKDVVDWKNKYLKQNKIENFWNTVYAIKFETSHKPWVNYLTAENVEWFLEKINLDNILINWTSIIIVPEMRKVLGKGPYTKKQILEYLTKHPEHKKALLKNSDKYATNTLPRDHYPVVGILQSDGKISLENGNRRTLRRILKGKKEIKIYVGKFTDNTNIPKNYIISRSWFDQFLLIANRDFQENGDVVINKYKDILKSIFKKSEVAYITYQKVKNSFAMEHSKITKELLDL